MLDAPLICERCKPFLFNILMLRSAGASLPPGCSIDEAVPGGFQLHKTVINSKKITAPV